MLRTRSILLLCLLAAIAGISPALGQVTTVRNLTMTRSLGPNCAVPQGTSSFLTTDGNAFLYYAASTTTIDNISSDWLAPNPLVLPGDQWVAQAGNFCFESVLNISNLLPEQLGRWTARIYNNGKQIASISFTVELPVATSGPVITSLSPTSIIAGNPSFPLTVLGTGFDSNSAVLWNGSLLPTTFLSPTTLKATITAGLVATTVNVPVTVITKGVISPQVNLSVTPLVPQNLTRFGALSHLAAGGGWDTAIYITNSSTVTTSVGLIFRADDGTRLSLPISETLQGKTTNLVTTAFSIVLPPNTTLVVDTGFLPSTVTGWTDVVSNGTLSGFAVFRYAPQGLSGASSLTTPWEGTVPLQTDVATTILSMAFDNTNGFATGLALGNLTNTDASYSASFYSEGGTLLATQTISLPGNGHTAFVVGASYPFTANQRGVVKIAGPAMTGLALRASTYGTLTAIPVDVARPIIGSPPRSANLTRAGILSQLAAGAGWDTAIYITNPSALPVSVSLVFHSDDGSAIALPASVSQLGATQLLTATTVSAVIPPNTTLTVDTGINNSLASSVEGWTEVLSNGAITGFAVFRFAPDGLFAGPGITTPLEGTVPLQLLLTPTTMTLPFDNTNGFLTGLSLGNLTTFGANFIATFFDDNGNQLGAPQTFSMGAGAHTSMFVAGNYPFTNNSRGTMKLNGPALMGLALRISPYGTMTSVSVPLK
jgi:hypothetical protein